MCLHSAYEAGGVVYLRGLDPTSARGIGSNACSNSDAGDGGNTRDVAAKAGAMIATSCGRTPLTGDDPGE